MASRESQQRRLLRRRSQQLRRTLGGILWVRATVRKPSNNSAVSTWSKRLTSVSPTPSCFGRKETIFYSLKTGRQRYMDHVARPPVQGGAAASSVKRYRAVLDKFIAFADRTPEVRYWQQVNKGLLTKYNRWLVDEGLRLRHPVPRTDDRSNRSSSGWSREEIAAADIVRSRSN